MAEGGKIDLQRFSSFMRAYRESGNGSGATTTPEETTTEINFSYSRAGVTHGLSIIPRLRGGQAVLELEYSENRATGEQKRQ